MCPPIWSRRTMTHSPTERQRAVLWTVTPGSSVLLFRGKLVRPHLGSMQHAQNPDGVSRNSVRRYICSAHDHQFAGSGYTTRSAVLQELNQAADCSNDLLIDMDCCARTIGFDMAEDVVTVRQRIFVTRPTSPFLRLGLTKRGRASFCEMGFDIGVGNIRPRVFKRLSDLGTEPSIVGFAVAQQLER